jgi:hypothetical protein
LGRWFEKLQNAKVFVGAIRFERSHKCEKCNGIGDITQKVADWKANYSKGLSQNIVEGMTGNEKISGEFCGWIAPEKVESGIV